MRTTPAYANAAVRYIAKVHYIADEFFEGLNGGHLGYGQGFVEALGCMNLNTTGVGDQNESAANLGGDFFLAYGFDVSGIHPWRREFRSGNRTVRRPA